MYRFKILKRQKDTVHQLQRKPAGLFRSRLFSAKVKMCCSKKKLGSEQDLGGPYFFERNNRLLWTIKRKWR